MFTTLFIKLNPVDPDKPPIPFDNCTEPVGPTEDKDGPVGPVYPVDPAGPV